MTAPKARPILFSAPMVLAILEGRKMQTRRVVKRQGDMEFDPQDPHYGPYWLAYAAGDAEGENARVRCPYGKPGDRLWVRETHALVPVSAYLCSKDVQQTINPVDPYYASIYRQGWDRSESGIRWRPSIHMPRWASRITLEIAAVRVERLQDISEDDARAEGINCGNPEPSAKDAFCYLWHQIHGCNSWHTNPWVWVVEFHRSSQPTGEVRP